MRLKRFPTCKKIFISSTRVYLNHQNEIVDENLPLKPSDQQGNIIQKYEKTILENDNNQILRLWPDNRTIQFCEKSDQGKVIH